MSQGVIARYGDLLGVAAAGAVSLAEGSTPLVASPSLSAALGAAVWLKLEGLNPTGSFKDRGMTVAVTRAVSSGATTIVCGSTGNTSASAAAYAARAGVTCVVLVPAGHVALGKLAQAVVLGARVVQVHGNFDDTLVLAREYAHGTGAALVNSVNPDRLLGQRSGAFEVVDELGRAPDVLALPVGNAGNITAYGAGFDQYRAAGRCATVPALWGFQASGAAPLVHGHDVEHPETVASAIRIGKPASGAAALAAAARTGGSIREVTDAEILDAWRRLAVDDGVFCEPASAASVAGLLRYGAPAGATVVCVLTGNGLKDPDTALSIAAPSEVIDATRDALDAALLTRV